jgi:16S rRNA (cytidine1402-2'-O)-methyltransferase
MPPMAGTLFIVSTPIGNLEDITQRALRVLGNVDLIASEDTRRTRQLLNHFGIPTRTISYHEHNERERAQQLCALLQSGKSIALVSDAGTPLINDPGFRIVQAAIENGIAVVPVPGAAALAVALVPSGLPTDQFFFGGFLPARTNARRARLAELKAIPATLIFYEAPHRIAATLQDALETMGDRPAVIARELTKLHEEFARGSLRELAQRMADAKSIKGEIVLLIAGSELARDADESEPATGQLVQRVRQLEDEGIEAKAALKKAARELGFKRAEAYRLLVAQKNRRSR